MILGEELLPGNTECTSQQYRHRLSHLTIDFCFDGAMVCTLFYALADACDNFRLKESAGLHIFKIL